MSTTQPDTDDSCIECGEQSGADARRFGEFHLCGDCADGKSRRERKELFQEHRLAAAEDALPDDPDFTDYLAPHGAYDLPIYTLLPKGHEIKDRIVERRASWLASRYDMDDRLAMTIALSEIGSYSASEVEAFVDVTAETVKTYMDAIEDEYGPFFLDGPPTRLDRPLPRDNPDAHDRLAVDVDVDLADDPRSFPDEMLNRRQWCCWTVQTRTNNDGETYRTKVPQMPWPSADENDPTNPDFLTTFTRADEYADMTPGWNVGFGFAVTGPFVGLDFDDCRDPETGEIDEWVMEIVERADSFAQISTSGTGIHVFLKGSIPSVVKNEPAGIEMYDRDRYFAMTGDHLEGTPLEIQENQALLDELHAEYKTGDGGSQRRSIIEDPDRATREYEPEVTFEELDITDVYDVPVGERCPHPVHGSSSTGANFIVEPDGGRGTCWRCDFGKGDGCGVNAQILLAMEATHNDDCGEMRRLWQDQDMYVLIAWLYAKKHLDVDLGTDPPPFRAIRYVADKYVDIDLSDGGQVAWAAYRAACRWIESEHNVEIDPGEKDDAGKIV